MLRRIIQIDREKCNGCGACVTACHEGAIGMVDNKAALLRDDYCDGLGDCLPTCPTGAITFVEREAAAYDEAAVKAAQQAKTVQATAQAEEKALPCGCQGSLAKSIDHKERCATCTDELFVNSQLSQWPVQIKLVPVTAPYFDGANLLIAADCTAYAYGNFHQRFIKNHITLVGCPKLDSVDYAEKLTAIISNNNIKGVTIVRMEVPCCGGLEHAVKKALQASGKFIPWQIHIISTDGRILEQ